MNVHIAALKTRVRTLANTMRHVTAQARTQLKKEAVMVGLGVIVLISSYALFEHFHPELPQAQNPLPLIDPGKPIQKLGDAILGQPLISVGVPIPNDIYSWIAHCPACPGADSQGDVMMSSYPNVKATLVAISTTTP